MIPALTFADKRVALFGLGGSGLATAQALVAGGADVVCWDDGEAGRAKAREAGLTVSDLAAADWTQFCALVLSPGVPLTHPAPHWAAARAHEAGVPVIGDIEIFCRERAARAPDAPFVAITGTNGKSTTTALIAHLFASFGHAVELGGNIGVPALSLEPPSRERVHVLELSTFQIDLAPSLKPSVGVLLNLTPDHIDRHGTMENYAAIKERLVAASDHAVVAVDDDFTRAIAQRLCERNRSCHARVGGHPGKNRDSRFRGNHSPTLTLISASGAAIPDGFVAEGTQVLRVHDGRTTPIADLAGIGSLRGRHNAQNAAAAIAALFAADPHRDLDALQRALQSFGGLPHRMEEVAREGRILFINDSKATNADAAEKALGSFTDIHWIAGGRAKEGGIAPLAPLFPRIAKAYLLGEAAEDFAQTLDGVPHAICRTLDAAVAQAAQDARRSRAPQPVVLLSPACASYDQFKNYEVRGDRFRDLVRSTLATTADGAAA